APGTYTIGIVAVYANCESDMVEGTVTIPDSVDENEIVSALYPNPTSGDLHINAEKMTRVSVYNAMGQMVYSQDVNADELILNMGQYEAGVYMVRIDTENGSSVKRVTVVK
ncbi:MAG: T9SS type A sorting domain-containing protein, partial [Bacteroidaceae bacterium]|nr:T9SS type A sorting domain-containing protein [Bacteroidaceae bacterium]